MNMNNMSETRKTREGWGESLKFRRLYSRYWEDQKAMLRVAKEDLKKGAGEERVKEWLDKLDPDYHQELKEFVEELKSDPKAKRNSSG